MKKVRQLLFQTKKAARFYNQTTFYLLLNGVKIFPNFSILLHSINMEKIFFVDT